MGAARESFAANNCVCGRSRAHGISARRNSARNDQIQTDAGHQRNCRKRQPLEEVNERLPIGNVLRRVHSLDAVQGRKRQTRDQTRFSVVELQSSTMQACDGHDAREP